VNADGTPSIDVVRTATDCADTEHWLEVDVYGPIILNDVSPTTYGIAAATQDFAFDVVIPLVTPLTDGAIRSRRPSTFGGHLHRVDRVRAAAAGVAVR
jgi:hypothetical protein